MPTPQTYRRHRPAILARSPALVAAALALLLWGCAAPTSVQRDDEGAGQAASQPTIYGQLGVSVDSVTVR
jgi:hypothetical protein